MNKLWRIFATGLCFSLFALGGLILTVLVLPVQRLFCQDLLIAQQRSRKTVQYAIKFFIGVMQITQISKFRVENRRKFSNIRGSLVICNHPSLIDVVLLISVIPDAVCIVKASLFKNPFIRGVLSNTGYISNDNAEQLIEDCRDSLAKGNNLIMFPEGTRTTPNKPVKFKRGVANIAIRCGSPIQCFKLTINPTTLTKNEKWYRVPVRKFQVELTLLSAAPQPNKHDEIPVTLLSRVYTRELEQFYNKELEKHVGLKG
ncbi:lysophospholipid acyltransferase family protein [Colwellia piezophila]|uniref:lysophospholipid acyltransferase family protein n=1 Tax=Colwellia piezophila TaxID=211668 RepID=UPI00036EA878|nr:lysophospholipid acyltransferase family protein [Colwellia piezophila]